MKYRSEWWAITATEKALDVLKVATDFGIAIAKIEFRTFRGKEMVDVALIMPYCEEDNKWCYTHRTFIRKLQQMSILFDINGIKGFDLVMSPYAPGIGPEIALEDCLYVPENFSTIDEPIKE